MSVTYNICDSYRKENESSIKQRCFEDDIIKYIFEFIDNELLITTYI